MADFLALQHLLGRGWTVSDPRSTDTLSAIALP
jgi:hypothetical protein